MAAALRPLLVGQHILRASARTPGPQMRMAGTWHRYAPNEPWRIAAWKARVVLEVAEHVLVCFNAPTAELMPARATPLHHTLPALGPDLLATDFSAEEVFNRLHSLPELEIAEALLDQRVMAGIGNVFMSEILFIERIN